MKIDLKRDKLGLFTPHSYKCKLKTFNVFNKLCDKAKELVFVYYHKENIPYSFLDVFDLDESLLEMSPIEQVLSVALMIYDFYANENLNISFTSQEIIDCDENTYIVDFYINTVYVKSKEEILLKKPLIVECDGFDYHSSKDQMNYDYTRENMLKTNGYDVMRFTGSQIYNDPFECVKKIYTYLSKVVEEQNGSI